MLVAETLGLLFLRHESIDVLTPEFSSHSSDGEHEQAQHKHKVYLKSALCNDDLIIGMVRRLNFDSNRDIKTPLKHIELPALPEPAEVELSDVALENMRRRYPPDENAEEIIDTSSTQQTTIISTVSELQESLIDKVLEQATQESGEQEDRRKQ